MPAKVRKNSGGGYTVSTPNAVHAKNTTKEKAEAQQRLLNAIDHGFEPNRKGNYSSRTEATEEMMETAEEEAKEMRAAERGRSREGRTARGGTRGNRSGGSMGEFHSKRSKL